MKNTSKCNTATVSFHAGLLQRGYIQQLWAWILVEVKTEVFAKAKMPAYITLSHYWPSSRPALMWPLHKLASHQFRCLDGTAVRGFAKYLELSHDKKRQQQMKHIKVARGTHKMLFLAQLLVRPGPTWGILKPTGLWVFTTLSVR